MRRFANSDEVFEAGYAMLLYDITDRHSTFRYKDRDIRVDGRPRTEEVICGDYAVPVVPIESIR